MSFDDILTNLQTVFDIGLNNHIKAAHNNSNAMLLNCSQCTDKFQNQKALDTHIGIVHERKMKCQNYSKMFLKKSELTKN